jgi:hypothetical protein
MARPVLDQRSTPHWAVTSSSAPSDPHPHILPRRYYYNNHSPSIYDDHEYQFAPSPYQILLTPPPSSHDHDHHQIDPLGITKFKSAHADIHTPPISPAISIHRPQLRQLTILPMLRTQQSSAIMLRSNSPGSPPDLTDSKSSKSSSFPSSSLPDDSTPDLRNFEDISLDDVVQQSTAWDQKPSLSSGPLRSRPNLNTMYRMNAQSRSLRDLTNTSRASTAGPPTKKSRSKFNLPLPLPRSPRTKTRQLVDSITPSLTPPHSTNRPSSISPQRTNRAYSPEARSVGHASSSSGHSARFSAASSQHRRRQSWQPGRKSVKQLEDEYDDQDEDLPDDAVIWNVPISPRPPHERELRRVESDSILSGSSTPMQLERADTGLTSISAPGDFAPHSPVLSDISLSAEYNPHNITRRDAALSDLSLEARELTIALETHAEERERKQEERAQNGLSSILSSSPPPASKVSLPPVRKNDPLIDPLPPSCEKEKHLTRTRPSWLPPKSQKEEKRHLKEYQRMMAHAAEMERKEAEKRHKDACARDAALLDRTKSWDTLLHSWPSTTNNQIMDLAWAGIPPQRRADIWIRASGNALGLSAVSYEAALGRGNDALSRLESLSQDAKTNDPLAIAFDHVVTSAATMHSHSNLFSETGPLHKSLLDVCRAYAAYRLSSTASSSADLSGVPGLAAALLINLPAPDAFIVLSNILHRPLPAALITNDLRTLRPYLDTLMAVLQRETPGLYYYLVARSPAKRTDDSQPSLADNLLLRILKGIVFASPRLSLDITSHILDVALLQDDTSFINAAAVTLERLEGYIYKNECNIWNMSNEDEVEEWSNQRDLVEIFIERWRRMAV